MTTQQNGQPAFDMTYTGSENSKHLALNLAKADSEKEVIELLTNAGYWDNDSAWQEFGGNPMNYSIIGNQQSSPDNALVEKIINSVDAVLIKECLKRGIRPNSSAAPSNIAEAQREYFGIYNGKLSSIDSTLRAELSKNIFLVATGSTTSPSYSIIDKGEGQTPKQLPNTILSLTKSNKVSIKFVQGQYGMGGSGVLRFCGGSVGPMLIISKRSREISADIDAELYKIDETRDEWGVTVVRREDPKSNQKNSHYTYLAPQNKILAFQADELPIIPGPNRKIHSEPMESGTYIKLYEYSIGNLATQIKFNLYYRLSLLVPNLALPCRLVERRKKYKADSSEIVLSGLSVRLDEDQSDNLEPDFNPPSSGTVKIGEHELVYSIYVFKRGKKKNYAGNEGLVFTVNGQLHGQKSKDFFGRKSINLSYLKNDILVLIDSSQLSDRTREKLFMPSRDRLAKSDISNEILQAFEQIIGNHKGLRELQHKRRTEMTEKLTDSKQFNDMIEELARKKPTLAELLSGGIKIMNPHMLEGSNVQDEYTGKEFPTFFSPTVKFTHQDPKQCQMGRRFEIEFETDAENDYFDRDKDHGKFVLRLNNSSVENFSISLYNGRARASIELPSKAAIGDISEYDVEITDISQISPFQSKFYTKVIKKTEGGGNRGKRKKARGAKKGTEGQKESMLDVPEVREIRKDQWHDDSFSDLGFNQFSALKVRSDGIGDDTNYTLFINMDNAYLGQEIIRNKDTDRHTYEMIYKYSIAILGISILDYFQNRKDSQIESLSIEGEADHDSEDETSVEDIISELTEAISPAILPVITSLSDFGFSD